MSQQMTIDGVCCQPEVTAQSRSSQRKRCYLIQQEHQKPPDRYDPDWDGRFTSEFYVATAVSKGQAVAATLDLLDDEGFRAAYAGRDGHLSEWTDGWSTVTVMAFSIEEDEFWELLGWSGSTVIRQALATWAQKNGRLAVQLLKAARAGGNLGHLAVAENQGVVGAVERNQLERSVKRQEVAQVPCGVKRL
ncbi:MAG: hypothetical protein H7228_09355 [Polaromonas sp.]|nr:hypothetical protein [Polaromonas sp.]